MRYHRMRLPFAIALAASLVVAGCGDQGTGPARADDARLLVSASVLGTPVATLVVEVSAADISPALIFNLTVADGIASGTLHVPPGESRTFTVRGEDVYGNVTHSGASTIDVRPGQNQTLAIILKPATGQVPITVTLGSVSVTLAPPTAMITAGQTAQLIATVRGVDGNEIADPPSWATSRPSVATVSPGGLVTALSEGEADIVVTYAGVAAVCHVTVVARDASFGNSTPFTTTTSVNADVLLGSFIYLTEPITLTHLAVIAASAGSSVKLALYTDLNGEPYALVAATGPAPVSVGRVEVPVPELVLDPGSYWLMASYDRPTLVGHDPTGQSKGADWPFATETPSGFPTAWTIDGTLNYYLKGHR